MELKRENINNFESYDKVMDERLKFFGKTIGAWQCDNCGFEIKSFLYNYECHLDDDCPKCLPGKMIENESKRESSKPPGFARGKQGEDKWMSQQSPLKQSAVLLGDDPDY